MAAKKSFPKSRRQPAAKARTSGAATSGPGAAGPTEAAAMPGGPGAAKACQRCGRRMMWRSKWRNNWDQVKVCSEACRRRRDPNAQALERAIASLAEARGQTRTLCPSEATRVVFGAPEGWPEGAMERTREAARRMVARGELSMLQGGQVVDPSHARGPIRLRKA